jgi:hypothetical protein
MLCMYIYIYIYNIYIYICCMKHQVQVSDWGGIFKINICLVNNILSIKNDTYVLIQITKRSMLLPASGFRAWNVLLQFIIVVSDRTRCVNVLNSFPDRCAQTREWSVNHKDVLKLYSHYSHRLQVHFCWKLSLIN